MAEEEFGNMGLQQVNFTRQNNTPRKIITNSKALGIRATFL